MPKKSSGTKSNNRNSVFVLDENIDISNINNLYTRLNTLLKETKKVTIDAKKLKRVDTSAIQLLCSWYKTASDKNIDVKWKNTKGVLENSVRLLGLEQLLAFR